MRHLPVLLVLCAALPSSGDVSHCACDATKPETLEARECSLCREAEMQPPDPPVFSLKDASPRKPQRWLMLPRSHGTGAEPLARRTPQERKLLWTAAIEKAKSLWGEEWGLAINGVTTRTQCHTHIHIGKLLRGVETRRFMVVDDPAKIPAPEDDSGLWVHPVGRKLHVHLGEQITETVLLR